MDSLLGMIFIAAFGGCIFGPVADWISEALERRKYHNNRSTR